MEKLGLFSFLGLCLFALLILLMRITILHHENNQPYKVLSLSIGYKRLCLTLGNSDMLWKGKNLTCFIRVSGTTILVSGFKTWASALLFNLIFFLKEEENTIKTPLNDVSDDFCVSQSDHRVTSQTCRAGTVTSPAPEFSIPLCSSPRMSSTPEHTGNSWGVSPHTCGCWDDICFQPSSQHSSISAQPRTGRNDAVSHPALLLMCSIPDKHSERTNPNRAEDRLCLKCIISNTAVKPEFICALPIPWRVQCSPCSPSAWMGCLHWGFHSKIPC